VKTIAFTPTATTAGPTSTALPGRFIAQPVPPDFTFALTFNPVITNRLGTVSLRRTATQVENNFIKENYFAKQITYSSN